MDVQLPASTVNLFPPRSLNYNGGDATYLFVDASLTVPNGATLQCMINIDETVPPPSNPDDACAPGPSGTNGSGQTGQYGVTFILTGPHVGNLTIEPGAIASLSAPGTNSFPDAPNGLLNGVLFYRRGGADDTAASPGVRVSDITGGVSTGGVNLNGIMYFPDSVVAYTGNTNGNYPPLCSIIVAGTLVLGPADGSGLWTQFSAACPAYRSAADGRSDIPNVQTAQVVE
jgi:hypothetical protein